MATVRRTPTATTVQTQFVATNGRRIAYRRLGDGPPIVLCLRFRGVMDDWDPAFLDALAAHFTVVTFDYSGLGQSTGTPSYNRESLARDALELVDALGFARVVMAGWSIGGIAAQIFAANHPERTSHGIFIATGPPGQQAHASEPVFLQIALKPDNTIEDEYILFFEPSSARSRAAADASHGRIASRKADRSPVILESIYTRMLQESNNPDAIFPDQAGYSERLAQSAVPMIAICGDHDIVFPVENWYLLNRKWKSLHIVTFPRAGHGPQHEHPQLCADLIASFFRNIH